MSLLMTLIILLTQVLLLIFFIVWVFYLISLFLFRESSPPFVPMSSDSLMDIVNALGLKPDSKLYDLGCGDGRVLFASFQNNPQAKYIGIDKHYFPFFWAKWNWFRAGKPCNVEFIRGNIWKYNYSDATHIFIFLFPALMNELLPKLERELRTGTILVSADFQFKNKPARQVLEFKRGANQWAKKLYIYEF